MASSTVAAAVPCKFDDFPHLDFREQYDGEELARFYNDFMRVNFPIEDELDPLEVWEEVLDPEQVDDFAAQAVHMHVVVVYAPEARDAEGRREIIGGVVFEYYLMSNASLMSYFAVAPAYRRTGLGRWLLGRAYATCHEKALSRPARSLEEGGSDAAAWLRKISRLPETPANAELHERVAGLCTVEEVAELQRLAEGGCDVAASLGYLFAETNAEGVEDGVLDPKSRHIVLHKMGFHALRFGYIQPPLSDTQSPCYDLLLLALQGGPATPHPTVPAVLVKLFLLDFSLSVFGCVGSFADAPWWRQMRDELHSLGAAVPTTVSPPWSHHTAKPE